MYIVVCVIWFCVFPPRGTWRKCAARTADFDDRQLGSLALLEICVKSLWGCQQNVNRAEGFKCGRVFVCVWPLFAND